ncbi:hypothetical protein H114_32609 [Streptomyces gancidicus BKS 13-15]|uniref:Uncharacterized protein n=1 Tax=Streptomyces gancidicus BKS 13-15 TaxID=1284664 RepID=M3C8H8_STREZ|nr:hypothetical protein [Streptomyces gancidicus]EMF20383.1 hypothetical protein H114_32609 [Streptomyces gancidicus BKS 13-15]
MITQFVKMTAENFLKAESEARAALAERLITTAVVDASAYETVMEATAAAKPWRDVLRIAENRTIAEAITAVRDRATSELLEYGESRSTSLIRNEEERMHREALRRFLGRTSGLVEQIAEEQAKAEQAADEQPAPQAEEPKAAPKAAPKSTPKPSPAQLRMIRQIAKGGVSVKILGHGRRQAFGVDGVGNTRLVETVIRLGFAEFDESTSFSGGRVVQLTDAGRAHA